jgi:prevent-host-death family protein
MVIMKRPTARSRARFSRRPRAGTRLAAAEFKATCLELMDRVRETGVEYVVTKHGQPVAKLVPYREPGRKAFFGSMKGTVLGYERPFDPIEADYDIGGD